MIEVRDFEAELEVAGQIMATKVRTQAPGFGAKLGNQPVDIRQPDTGLEIAADIPLDAWVRRFVLRDPSTLPPRGWLYGSHYIRKFVSATFAPGGVGKSSLVIAEALAMASNQPLLGTSPTNRLKVAYWNGEDPIEEVERRTVAAALHFSLRPDDVEGWLFLGSGRDQPLILAEQQPSGTIIRAPDVERVLDAVRKMGLDVIIIDPFVSTHRVNENDNNAINLVVKEWARIADLANVSVELVHHTRKSNGNVTGVEDGRGASALLYAARSARALNVMSKEEADRAGVERHRSYFRVDNGKSNLALPPEGSDWFQMVNVNLDNGDAFNEGDQVGVVTRWTRPDPVVEVTAADLYAVQKHIAGGHWRESNQATEWVGRAVAEVLGLDLENRGDMQKVKWLLATWIKTGALVRTMAKDQGRKERPVIEVGRWAEAA